MRSICSRLLRAAVLLGTFVLACAPPAIAAPVAYELQGMATGTIGGSSFSNDSFTLIGTGDTSGSVSDGFGNSYNNLYSLVLSLNGFGTASASDPMQFFSSQSGTVAGFTDLTLGSDVFDVSGPALATYDGVSGLSPTSVSSFFLFGFPTTQGTANIAGATNLTFFVSGAPSSIPEPGTLSLTGLAFAAASIGYARKRRTGHRHRAPGVCASERLGDFASSGT